MEDGITDLPVVCLYGVLLGKTLWAEVNSQAKGKMSVFVDMPAHGNSDNVGHDWSINDCAEMLIRIMNELAVQLCMAFGHSWGGMAVLRAAVQFVERFAALGFLICPL